MSAKFNSFLVSSVLITLIGVTQAQPFSNSSNFPITFKTKQTFLGKLANVSRTTVNSSTRCGQVLNCSTGGIFYKPFETILANERCVWTVAVNGATSYRINVLHLGFEGADKMLSIAGFRLGDESAFHVQPTSTGKVIISNSNILVITFHSGEKRTMGFVFEYSAETVVNPPTVNVNSRHEIISQSPVILKHPISRQAYLSNELSSFVFVPLNNVIPVEGRGGGKRDVIYTRIGLDTSYPCNDKLFVYAFNTFSGTWINKRRICDEVDSQLISNEEIVLVLFHSDASRYFMGFYLAHLAACS